LPKDRKARKHMEFRWVALITLWTLLAGPVFDSRLLPRNGQEARSNPTAKASPRN